MDGQAALAFGQVRTGLRTYDTARIAMPDIAQYLQWYNFEPAYSSLNKQTPNEAY